MYEKECREYEMNGARELIVTEIISSVLGLEKKAEIKTKIMLKYYIGYSQFIYYYKIASRRIKERQHTTQLTIITNASKEQIKLAVGAVMSRNECLIEITKIIRDPENMIKRPLVVLKAISQLCEMEGYNKAIEVANTIDVPIISWANDNA